MAEETPFGLSFGNYGDPRRYIGKGESPAKKIQEKIAKIQKSPLANIAGILMAGGDEESSGQGVAPPTLPQVGVNPVAPVGVPPAPVQMQAPNTQSPNVDLDGDGQIDNFWGIKSPQSSIDVQNKTDFNPLSPDANNQMAMNPNDYQKVQGYGKLQKIASAIFGQG